MINLQNLTEQEFTGLFVAMLKERDRRDRLARLPEQLNQNFRELQEAKGLYKPGQEWTKPASIEDSYFVGALVKHGGKLWRSTVFGNMETPTATSTMWVEAKADDPGLNPSADPSIGGTIDPMPTPPKPGEGGIDPMPQPPGGTDENGGIIL